MPKADPKGLATAILRARAGADYDAIHRAHVRVAREAARGRMEAARIRGRARLYGARREGLQRARSASARARCRLARLEGERAALLGNAYDSDTLLARAVRLGDTEAVATLLKMGADPNQEIMRPRKGDKFPDDGNGPMVNAVRTGNVDILKLLVNAGGNPAGETYTNRPLTALAKDLKNKKVIAYLASCTKLGPPKK